jgi:hypothetical protein
MVYGVFLDHAAFDPEFAVPGAQELVYVVIRMLFHEGEV